MVGRRDCRGDCIACYLAALSFGPGPNPNRALSFCPCFWVRAGITVSPGARAVPKVSGWEGRGRDKQQQGRHIQGTGVSRQQEGRHRHGGGEEVAYGTGFLPPTNVFPAPDVGGMNLRCLSNSCILYIENCNNFIFFHV